MIKIFIIIYTLAFLQPLQLSSQETNSVDTNTNTSDTNSSGFLDEFYIGTATEPSVPVEEPLIFTLLKIAVITAILGFLTWIILRFFFRKNILAVSTGGKSIEILATVPAGLGTYFLITKLGHLYYLMSLSSDGLRLLDKITDQEAIDFIELNRESTLPQDVKFIDLLDKLPEGKPKKALEFLREKVNELKKINRDEK